MNINELNSLFYQKAHEPFVMGILNLDPESFYKPSFALNKETALNKVEQMLKEGMDILDIGAFSSKPGMKIPEYEEERTRLFPILRSIHSTFPDLLISIDTMRAEIAEEAIESGAEIINDISAANFDIALPIAVAKYKKIYIAMHMKGLPENMMHLKNTNYRDILYELLIYFSEKLKLFRDLGLNKVIIDPGFGFSKTQHDNYVILKNLNILEILDKPILVGISRKSMIWKTIHSNIQDALLATKIAEFFATLKGCNIIRVHDVKETKEMLTIYRAIYSEIN